MALFSKHYEDNSEVDQARSLHHTVTLSSIIYSSMYLEAVINEYIYLSTEKSSSTQHFAIHLPEKDRRLIKQLVDLKHTKLIDKYILTVLIVSGHAYDTGSEPYQSISEVISLRNSFIHYKMKETPVIKDGVVTTDLKRLEDSFGSKYSPNPFTKDGEPFFPDRLLSYERARWAHNSIAAFVRDFYDRAGSNPYSQPPENI